MKLNSGKFTIKCRKMVEMIDELEIDEDYEFMTEQEMQDAGWEECLRPSGFHVSPYS